MAGDILLEKKQKRKKKKLTVKALSPIVAGDRPINKTPCRRNAEAFPLQKPFVWLADLLRERRQLRRCFFRHSSAAWHQHPHTVALAWRGGRGGRLAQEWKMSCTKQPFLLQWLKELVGHSGPFHRRWPTLGNVSLALWWEPFSSIWFCLQCSQKGWEENAERRH